jgi:ubiquinone/menaquinone biosynthesis C-methylase UbiE
VQPDILTAAEVAVLETFVVPRYLAAFGAVALDMMLVGESASVVHLGCRTGYPDRLLREKVANCRVVGVDVSPAAIELARNKAGTMPGSNLLYMVAPSYPTTLTAQSYSHALSLHPLGGAQERGALFREMERLVYPGGQVLVSMPLRGSYQELGDLFREYSLKYDEAEFAQAVELAMNSRPTIEEFSEELEQAGLTDIDIEVVSTELSFSGGRSFVEDPTTRLLIIPELDLALGRFDLSSPLTYVCDAIDAYWAGGTFPLSVRVGCASARRR